MINLLTQFPELEAVRPDQPRGLGLRRISDGALALIRRTREVLPHVKLVQGYGLSETGFLTGLQDHEHTEDQAHVLWADRVPAIDVRVVDESGRELEAGTAW